MTRFPSFPTRRFGALLLALAGVGVTATACESSEARPGSAASGASSTAAAVASGASAQLPTRFEQEAADEAPVELLRAQETLADSRQTAIVRAAERVAPGVVSISTITTRRVQTFFGSRNQRGGGFGSGFVIDADEGIVVTNEHVIRGAERIQVTLYDGTDLAAELIGADETTDVAILRVPTDRGRLVAVPLGTSEELLIGEWAIALGNPVGVQVANPEPTVTTGVVSATGRHIVPNDQDQSFYLGMIQTDAAINPGNSGGPLVNSLGQVIGVNSSIFSRSGGSEGLGFAIPIDRALRVADDLLATGEVRRAWLGMQVDGAETDAWGRARGVVISEVFGDSPARDAGIRPGRIVHSANGRRLKDPLDWEDVLLDLREGDPVVLEIEDEGTVTLVTGPYPSAQAMRVQVLDDLDVISVTPQIRAERGLAVDRGALVVGITEELRQISGLAENDVILRVVSGRYSRDVASADDLTEAFRTFEEADRRISFRFYIARGARDGWLRDLTYTPRAQRGRSGDG